MTYTYYNLNDTNFYVYMAVLVTHFLDLRKSFTHSLFKHMRARIPNSELYVFINRQHKTEEIQPVYNSCIIFV